MAASESCDELIQILLEAAKNVPEEYFKQPVAGGQVRYAERVYCYELYHQLREKMKSHSYSLFGEPDKKVILILGVIMCRI